MAIKISCACGKTLSVKDSFAGRTVKCPACQNPLSVPVPQAEDAASDGDWVSANDVAEGDESDREFHELLASHNEPESAASSKHGSKRSAENRSSASSSGASELQAVQASKVRAGISCYFFGFLLMFFAACYVVVTPTLHQGDFGTILRVIRGAGYVSLLAEIVTAIGLGLCLTVPKAMTRRNVLFVGVLSGLLGVLISGAVLWSPLFPLRVGRWLPQIVMITTQLSFLLFVRWLGEFLRHPEITRQATRVLVCFGLYFAVWLLALGAQIPMPNMVARGGMGGLVVMAAMLIVWIAAGILGFFGLLRLLSTCRAALRVDESSSKLDGERDEAAGAAWFSRSDVLKLGVGSAVVVLSFWGWFFVRQPAPVTFPFPIAAPGGRTAVVTPGKTTLLLVGHQGLVNNLAFSPDWTRIATASWDKTIKVWDATSGKELLTLSKHSEPVRRVVFSPDGKRLASASADKTVKIWDSVSGAELRTLASHATGIWTVVFSADGQRLASVSEDKLIKVWNAETGQEQLTLKGHAELTTSLAFSPDGRWLVSADNDVKVWNATNGNEVRTVKGHKTMVTSMAFRPDGKQLATASHDSTVKLWDTTSWKESHSLLGHSGPVGSLAYRPDGKRLASTGGELKVKVWDSETGQLCRTISTMSPGNLSYSPDGKRLATFVGFGNVEMLDNPADQPLSPQTGHTGIVTSVAFSPDGQQLASASTDQSVRLWDASTGQPLGTFKGHDIAVTQVAFDMGGTSLISGAAGSFQPGNVKVWNIASGKELRTLAVSPASAVSVSENGSRIASPNNGFMMQLSFQAGQTQSLLVWDAKDGRQVLEAKGHSGPIKHLALSHDGQWVASAGGAFQKPGEVKVRNTRTGHEQLNVATPTSGSLRVALSHDGKRLAIAHTDRRVQVWDVNSGRELATFNGHSSQPNALAFSPDGVWVASGTGMIPGIKGDLKLWNASTGQDKVALQGHADGITSLSFSPDGTRLASGSNDETIRIWETSTGQELLLIGVPIQ